MPPVSLNPISFGEISILNRPLVIDHGCVHLWLVSLRAEESDLTFANSLLSPQERARSAQFRSGVDAERFALSHAALRLLLGSYCKSNPRELRILIEPDGKPYIEPDRGAAPTFNISHSGDRVLIAVAGGGPVGVDIEASGPRNDPVAIANRYFVPAEAADVAAARLEDQNDRFLEYWVAKEAVLKAAGLGLYYPLNALHVQFSTDRQYADVKSLEPLRLAPDFGVRMLDCGPGWRAAVATRGFNRECRPVSHPIPA